MSAPSAKALFRATKAKPKAEARQTAMHDGEGWPEQPAPRDDERRADDFYPTGQPEAIRALLAADGARIRRSGTVWEPAVGAGDLAREIAAFGLKVEGSDIVDRGWPGTRIESFLDAGVSRGRAIITNPPYDLINCRDGQGRWLRHTLNLPGWDYCAYLLSWDWPAARKDGFGDMLDAHPFSWCYLMRWKLDFTGDRSPPQRNAWFVWDKCNPRAPHGSGRDLPEPAFRWLDRTDWRQLALATEVA